MPGTSTPTSDPRAVLRKRKRPQDNPCHAILGSRLLSSSPLRQSDGLEQSSSKQLKRCANARVQTGWGKYIDDRILDEGLRGITSAAVQESEVGLKMLYATVTANLLSHPSARAFLITTPNSFSPYRLYRHLCAHLRASSKDKSDQRERNTIVVNQVLDVETQAKVAMERVQVMRTFDLEGCLEAVLETGEWLKRASRPSLSEDNGPDVSHRRTRRNDEEPSSLDDSCMHRAVTLQEFIGPDEKTMPDLEHQSSKSENENRTTLSPREIADSQAPSSAGEEVLWDELRLPNPAMEAIHSVGPHLISSPTVDSFRPDLRLSDIARKTTKSPVSATRMLPDETLEGFEEAPIPALILFPTLAPLVSAQMRRNHVRAHALLVQLLRIVHQLCLAYLTCSVAAAPTSSLIYKPACLIINTVVGGRGPVTPLQAGPSIFAANAGIRPALGKTYGHLVDVSLLITRLPRAPSEATTKSELLATEERGGNMLDVLEVTWDKHGNRGGRWGILF